MQQQTVPNLVQGVSQQAPQARRDTQCEAQWDCLNQAVEGATARPGLELRKQIDTDDNEGAFFYDIIRDGDERYTVIIKDGNLRVINYLTGDECTVTHLEDVSDYLKELSTIDGAPAGALDRDYWCATTGEDDTFIASKLIKPQMGTIKSPARPPEALFWFRAGGYMLTYQISVKLEGTWYNWAYTTPDNSAAGNAEYIATDQICYALYNAMLTDPTNPITGLGFNIARVGNIMRLWRTDGKDFDIETIDGQNNVQLSGIKGSVGGLEFLPRNGFEGMSFKMAGAEDAEADDWYVVFSSEALAKDSTTQGAWIETVKSNTVINLAYETMPLYLFNTAPNEFELSFAAWGDRVSGDGVESAKDPSFIGKYIEDISYDQRRLNIMTKGSTVWSRTNNPLVFFPDTSRASLATAPIDTNPRLTKGIAILRTIVQTNGVSYLWADGKQISVLHGNNSVFSNSSIDTNQSSEFEWNTGIRPVGIGRELIFTTALGEFSSFTSVTYDQGFPVDDEDISEHVPKYVPSDLLEMIASFTAKKMFVLAKSTPNRLYVYEYRLTREGRVQSSWNTWRLPKNCTILHTVFDKAELIVYLKRPEGTFLTRCSVAPREVDPEGGYLTRLDLRVDEGQCIVNYDDDTNKTTVELPYAASDLMDYTLRGDQRSVMLVVRENYGEDFKRGTELTIEGVVTDLDSTTLTFDGDLSSVPFYAGFRIRAERVEGVFYVRNPETGYVYVQRVQVMRAILSFAETGYTRFELRNPKNNRIRRVQEFEGRTLGDIRNVFDEVVLSDGDFDCGVGENNSEAEVRWINDSFLPSSWQGMAWWYTPTQRAQG